MLLAPQCTCEKLSNDKSTTMSFTVLKVDVVEFLDHT